MYIWLEAQRPNQNITKSCLIVSSFIDYLNPLDQGKLQEGTCINIATTNSPEEGTSTRTWHLPELLRCTHQLDNWSVQRSRTLFLGARLYFLHASAPLIWHACISAHACSPVPKYHLQGRRDRVGYQKNY